MSTRRFLLAAAFAAMAFTFFACSGDEPGGDGNSSSSGATQGGGGNPSSSSNGNPSSSVSCPVSAVSNGSVACGGQTYRTEQIGEQVWFAENLNYNAEGSRCYDNDPENCKKYGRLYDWATAMKLSPSCNSNLCAGQIQPKHQGICPNGWHIPNYDDWNELFRYVDSENGGYGENDVRGSSNNRYYSYTAGKYLKATADWNDDEGQSGNGTDNHRFSALPGGEGYSGSFSSVGNRGNWWSADEHENYAYQSKMSSSDEYAYWDGYYKSSLFSVRCLKD